MLRFNRIHLKKFAVGEAGDSQNHRSRQCGVCGFLLHGVVLTAWPDPGLTWLRPLFETPGIWITLVPITLLEESS